MACVGGLLTNAPAGLMSPSRSFEPVEPVEPFRAVERAGQRQRIVMMKPAMSSTKPMARFHTPRKPSG